MVVQFQHEIFTFAREILEEQDLPRFEQLLTNLETIMSAEQEAGHGQLRETIPDIVDSQRESKHPFQDGKITYLPDEGRIIAVGDTHGDSVSTQKIVEQSRFLEAMAREENVRLVFLGDYVHRGKNDVGNMTMIYKLKEKFPENVVLLEGNHEHYREYVPNSALGESLSTAFSTNTETTSGLLSQVDNLAKHMPNMVITGNGMVMVHAGLPTPTSEFNLLDIQQNQQLQRALYLYDPIDKNHPEPRVQRGQQDISYSEADFTKTMDMLGGKVAVRAHENMPGELFFDDKLLVLFSTGAGSDEAYYQKQSVYGEFDLTKPISRIDKEQQVHQVRDVL